MGKPDEGETEAGEEDDVTPLGCHDVLDRQTVLGQIEGELVIWLVRRPR